MLQISQVFLQHFQGLSMLFVHHLGICQPFPKLLRRISSSIYDIVSSTIAIYSQFLLGAHYLHPLRCSSLACVLDTPNYVLFPLVSQNFLLLSQVANNPICTQSQIGSLLHGQLSIGLVVPCSVTQRHTLAVILSQYFYNMSLVHTCQPPWMLSNNQYPRQFPPSLTLGCVPKVDTYLFKLIYNAYNKWER